MKPRAHRRNVDGRSAPVAATIVLSAVLSAVLSGCAVRTGGSMATQGSAGMEFDVDRPGSDFTSFDLSAPNPESCRDACASDGRCQAYTYVKPGRQGPNARCWLKSSIPPAVTADCCVSGVKGYTASPPPPQPVVVSPPAPTPPPPQPSTAVRAPAMLGAPAPRPQVFVNVPPPPAPPSGYFEQDVDRPGSDIQNFDLPQADPAICQRACFDNPSCVAFTFVRPGVQGPHPRCWLKNATPAPVRNPCCVSGLKNPLVAGPPPGHRRDEDHDGRGRHGGRRHGRGGDDRDGRLEHNVDRPGSDFQNFDLPRAEPELCERACRDNGNCRSFTFVRPGVQGPNPRCWLKNSVPQPVQNGCCVSGVR